MKFSAIMVQERLWIIFVIRERPNLGGGGQGRFGKRSNFSVDFFTPSLTLLYVQQFPNIHLSHQIYTLLKSIRVKYEGRNRRCGNSFICATISKHPLITHSYKFNRCILTFVLACFLGSFESFALKSRKKLKPWLGLNKVPGVS